MKTGADVKVVNKNSDTALIYAAQSGDSECVASLLTAGADVNTTDGEGYTALIRAIQKGHSKCVDLLLKAGANVITTTRNTGVWEIRHTNINVTLH